MNLAPAIFLDRDGTLVEPRHYPSRPEELILYPNLAPQLRHLRNAGFRLAIITNQSGLARGYFDEADLARMHAYIRAELRRDGVEFDGIFHCPHHPDDIVPELAVDCSCRKPELGLLLKAAADLQLDLERSWLIGDILDDVEAGNRAGCRTILVDLCTESAPATPLRAPHYVARDTEHALRIVRAIERIGPPVDLGYLPTSWKTYRNCAAIPKETASIGVRP